MKRLLISLGIVMWMLGAAKATEMKVTAAHQAFADAKGWLNVSRPLQPEDLKGRIILLDFWTFCCINCMHIIPDLQYLEEKFGDKLTVIGVHSAKFLNEQDSENIRNAVLRYGIHHPVINDKDFSVWKKFGVRAWPTLVLINPQGMIAQVYSGEGHRDEMEEDIATLIKANGDKLNNAPLPIALEIQKEAPTYLRFPSKLEYAEDSKTLFISDSAHNRIVATNLKGEVQYVIGSGKQGNRDGSFAEAEFHSPQGMAYRAGTLYIADTENHTLREIDITKKQVRTIAGTGVQGYERRAKNDDALGTALASPWDVAFYPDAQHLAIAMAGTHQLWSYDIAKKTVSILAGNGSESIDDGTYPANSLSQPSGLAALGDALYFVDSETSSLRVFKNGEIKTLIGSGLFDFGFKDGKQGAALLQHSLGVYADETGVYIADSYNHAIRKYDVATGKISTLVGNGKRGDLNEPNDIIKIDEQFYVADTNAHRLRILNDGELQNFDVREHSSVKKQKPEQLPNLIKTPAQKILAGALPVEIILPKGWKINAEAPSYLALYEGKKEELLQQWGLEDVKKLSLQTSVLKSGDYTLQGTLYYCEDTPNAPCLLASVSQALSVTKNGADKIQVELK